MQQEIERAQQALAGRISTLPRKEDGKLDLSALGDPSLAGKAFGIEVLGQPDQWLERMKAFFTEPSKPE
jgi:hypothetical protein